MKKSRGQRPIVPISLSSKRSSLNSQQLFTPYKIDWKGTPLQAMENNTSKNFFQTMKSELSTIKNDFQKLIKKDSIAKSDHEDSLRQGSAKGKCQSALRKLDKSILESKLNLQDNACSQTFCKQSDINGYSNLLILEKNLPCAMTYDMRQHANKSAKEKSVNRSESTIQTRQKGRTQQGTIQQNSILRNKVTNNEGIDHLKDDINRFKNQLSHVTTECLVRKKEAEAISQDKARLAHNLQLSQKELQVKIEQIREQEEQIRYLTEQLTKSQKYQNEHWQMQRNNWQIKVDEVNFHNQNIGKMNVQLGKQNEQLRDNLMNLQHYIEEIKHHSIGIQNDLKRKAEHSRQEIMEYQKRQDIFTSQIDNLTKQLTSKTREVQLELQQFELFRKENEYLIAEKAELHKEVEHYKKLVEDLQNRVQIEIKSKDFKHLGEQFEGKMHDAVQQTYRLKNRIAHLQAEVIASDLKNKALQEQIQIYEVRNEDRVNAKALKADQWEEMMEQIDKLKQDNKMLIEKHEYEVLKRENLSSEAARGHQDEDTNRQQFNRILKEQIITIQNQQNEIAKQTALLEELRKQLESQSLLYAQCQGELKLEKLKKNPNGTTYETEINKITTKHKELFKQIVTKSHQLKQFEHFIYRVLLDKINKKEDEQEICYFLKELRSLLSQQEP